MRALWDWYLSNLGWFVIIVILLWQISWYKWRCDHGGKKATDIWREVGHDV